MKRRLRLAALVAGTLCLAPPAAGHEVRPSYLELRELEPRERDASRYEVLWKVPARGERRLALDPVLPASCRDGEHRGRLAGGAWVERWLATCPGGLEGGRIEIGGLPDTRTDVLVRIEWRDGARSVARLTPDEPAMTAVGAAGGWQVARTYLGLGVEHILLGVDHLLFVLALLFLVADWRRLVATVTAFTVAHSLTLSAATLGWPRLPQAPVEAVIALSIVFVAAELARGDAAAEGLARRRPWLVAFAFGLLHGLGFAAALREVGVPDHAVGLALLCFNIGVELGQLVFVAAVFGLLAAVPRVVAAVGRRFSRDPWVLAGALARPAAYGIGPVAAFWLVERTRAFWG